MCLYIFGCFTFKILGQTLLLWFIVCFFTFEILLFIIIFIHKHYYHFHYYFYYYYSNVAIAKYIAITFQFFTTLTTYILAICWFKIWFPFCHVFFSKLDAIIFCGFFKLYFVPFFFPHSFSVVTVNCDNRGRIQINEFERHSLPLPFNSDW